MATDTPFCCMIGVHYHDDKVLVVMTDGRAAVFSLTGTQLGPVLPEPITGGHFTMLPRSDLVIIGQYNQKTVTAYRWRTGERLWRLKCYKELFSLHVCGLGTDRLLVQQITRRSRELNVATGGVLSDVDRVISIDVEDSSDQILLLRGELHKEPKQLEYRSRLDGKAIFAKKLELGDFYRAAFGRTWIALTEHEQGQILCFDHDGTQLWKYTDGAAFHFPCFVLAPDGKHLFVIRRSKFEQANVAMLIHGESGTIVKQKEISKEHLAYEPASGGQYVVGRDGLLRLPDMVWERREFKVE